MSGSLSRRGFVSLSLATLTALGATGCSGGTDANPTSATSSPAGSITAVGSTAMQPLVEAAAEQFMAENPDVQITVQGGGSGQGITQVFQGAVQIGNSDVFAERKLDDPADAARLRDNRVAVVGMGPVAHPGVGVKGLTMGQLADVFSGKVANWSELGGQDQEVVVINRASGSGTRATFEGVVLAGREVPEGFAPQEQDSSGTVSRMVAQTPGAISYLAFSYLSEDVLALTVDGVAPEASKVETNEWAIWAYEHMYTAADPDPATQAFVDHMLSDAVQGSLVEQMGYIPVAGMRVSVDADGTVTRL